jgi:molybdopterin-guanine dinucleotide biosynthesis protein A
LGGLYTGLKQAMTPSVFAVACDMPFLDPLTIRYFLTVQGEADLVMANLPNGLHPMHALYHRRCLPVMESLIQTHELIIQQLADHPSLRVRLVTADELVGIDPAGRSFYNVNTPADLQAARSLQGKILPQSS